MDFAFPLPLAELHRRYDPVFRNLLSGQNCLLVGHALSGKSAFLKFILQYDTSLTKKFISGTDYKYFFIQPNPKSSLHLIELLNFELGFKSRITATADTFLAEAELLKNLANYSQPIIIILYEPHTWLTQDLAHTLKNILQVGRKQPSPSVRSLCIASPVFLDILKKPEFSLIQPLLTESINDFPLLNEAELQYTRLRQKFFTQQSISNTLHRQSIVSSGGHHLLYKQLTNCIDTSSTVEAIWNGLSYLQKQNRTWDIPLLNTHHTSEPTSHQLPLLTSQQKLLLDYFSSHPGQIIDRDTIASLMWGAKSQIKYSDWAIDKSISKLKKSLQQTENRIITIKNRGYMYERTR